MNLNDERRLIVGLLSRRDPAQIRQETLAWAVGAVRTEVRRRRVVRSVSQVCAVTVLGFFVLALYVRPFRPVAPDVPGADHLAEAPASSLRGTTDLSHASLPLPGPAIPLGRQESMIEARRGATSDTENPPVAKESDSFHTAPGRSIAIETIDDRELLALLAGRTVALIGPPGDAQLLVLGAPRSLGAE